MIFKLRSETPNFTVLFSSEYLMRSSKMFHQTPAVTPDVLTYACELKIPVDSSCSLSLGQFLLSVLPAITTSSSNSAPRPGSPARTPPGPAGPLPAVDRECAAALTLPPLPKPKVSRPPRFQRVKAAFHPPQEQASAAAHVRFSTTVAHTCPGWAVAPSGLIKHESQCCAEGVL